MKLPFFHIPPKKPCDWSKIKRKSFLLYKLWNSVSPFLPDIWIIAKDPETVKHLIQLQHWIESIVCTDRQTQFGDLWICVRRVGHCIIWITLNFNNILIRRELLYISWFKVVRYFEEFSSLESTHPPGRSVQGVLDVMLHVWKKARIFLRGLDGGESNIREQ